MSNLRNSTSYVKQGVFAILGKTQTIKNSINNQTTRTFTQTSQLNKSKDLYDDLQISKTATQSEIKSAYYALSKIYHPDRNKTEEAQNKFRRITEAYEVLGNFRTRRMYDKGIGTFTRNNITESPGTETEIIREDVEDDAQTKFYKQHMMKSRPPVMADRTTALEFDQWAANSITRAFKKKQRGKRLFEEDMHDRQLAMEKANELAFIIYPVMLLICFTLIYEYLYDKNLDKANKQNKLNQKKS